MTERELLLRAVPGALAEHRAPGLSPERIAAAAGLPAASFSAHFGSVAGAVLASQDLVVARYRERLAEACRGQSDWPFKVKVAIGASLDLAAASPEQARMLDPAVLGGEPQVVRSAFHLRDQLASLLAKTCREGGVGDGLPTLTEQALVGGLCSTVLSRLDDGEAKRLPDLASQLVEITLMPFLGRSEAARIARRPAPQRG
ncbi:MAG TPA: hypothetical protein VMT37_11595 [Solirubrobacterales bacterium]|nr:hypothetical protein [Solirubrobacterales bacterium]